MLTSCKARSKQACLACLVGLLRSLNASPSGRPHDTVIASIIPSRHRLDAN